MNRDDVEVKDTPPHVDAADLERIEWPTLEPLDGATLPLFPVDCLPPVLSQWVAEESESTQTPPDMAALLALTVCAATLAKRVVVSPWPGYVEPVNLYAAAILDPANRKSAVFSDATRPLRRVEAELQESQAEPIAEKMSDHRQAEKRLAKLEREAAEGKDEAKRSEARDEARTLARQLASWTAPALPTLIVDDATSEKLAVLLAQNNERLASMSAEGGVFDLMAGKYSKGMTDVDVYLKGHSGDSLRVQRLSRETVSLDSPALTMGLAIQPEVVRGLADRPAFRGRGLLGRFLYAVPKSWIGNRKIATPPVSAAVSLAYERVVQSLARIEPDEQGQAHRLQLDADACETFKAFCQWIENELGSGDLEAMRDWGGKLAGAVLRVAGVMHCAYHVHDAPTSTPVDATTIAAAQRIGQWAIPHAAAAFSLLHASGFDEARDDARYLLRWLRNQAPIPATFTRRDAYRYGHRRFENQPERLDAAFGVLSEGHYIRKHDSKHRGGNVTYDVSPRLMETASGGANGANRPPEPTANPLLAPLAPGFNGSGNEHRQRVTI